ncbi:MAG: arginine--tRNA ligase, partial [Candidatus Eremiobacteraeota bacterium]|nr:arginine--tRNA ligase [Candidatus Eremiobacteraeota bacterium]
RVVAATVEQLAPQRLSHYAREVASDFHQFYTHCRILEQDRDTRLARLGLSIAAQQVLASVLGLIGVSAPTSM